MRRVKANEFGAQIAKILNTYADDVHEGVRRAAVEVAKAAVKEIKTAAPVNTGHYRKGWTQSAENINRLSFSAIVHNRTDYQLTHLLEKGHALRRGGRTTGQVKARPHIARAEEHAIENMRKAVEALAKG